MRTQVSTYNANILYLQLMGVICRRCIVPGFAQQILHILVNYIANSVCRHMVNRYMRTVYVDTWSTYDGEHTVDTYFQLILRHTMLTYTAIYFFAFNNVDGTITKNSYDYILHGFGCKNIIIWLLIVSYVHRL